MNESLEIPKDFLRQIPDNLPIPLDDGLCDHITGMTIPSINLPSTSMKLVNLSQISSLLVVYCYPMTGKPNQMLPDGWIQIPGAAGCTPQSCSFRDRYQDLQQLQVIVFGVSTQTTKDQTEAIQRLNLPFELLSDESLEFAKGLNLPTFEVQGRKLLKRVTLIIQDRQIIKHFYPVFPPNLNVDKVLAWLQR